VITVYATGSGQTDPPSVTGQISGAVSLKPLLPVTVLLGGLPADVLYSGSPPGFSTAVLQGNTRIPDSVGSGMIPISLMVGSDTSQAGVTVATAP
jgi:uncharacterized protein (TIGR03437 family)